MVAFWVGIARYSKHAVHRRETDGRRRPARPPALVINFLRSGKDRVKDFVIRFTSSPSSANERPVIPFLNLAGYPFRDCGAATGPYRVREMLPYPWCRKFSGVSNAGELCHRRPT